MIEERLAGTDGLGDPGFTGALAEHAILQAGRRGCKRLRCVGVEFAGTGGEGGVRNFLGGLGHGDLRDEKGEGNEGNGDGKTTHRVAPGGEGKAKYTDI